MKAYLEDRNDESATLVLRLDGEDDSFLAGIAEDGVTTVRLPVYDTEAEEIIASLRPLLEPR